MVAQTVAHLRISSNQTPSPSLDQDRQLLDLSKRCTETADELLNELGKLKLHQGGAWPKFFKKACRSVFKKTKLDSLRAKLDEYQKLLNTGILARLNAQDILQSQNLASLSLEVRNLAAGLEQGHRTVADLLPTLSRSFEEHVARQFVLQEQELKIIKQRDEFKDSLSFSEMFKRQVEIVEAYPETCHWIFNEPDQGFHQSLRQSRKGSSFAKWLENGKDVYWLSGKPGSGKSTLMKYLSDHCKSSPRLTKWANGNGVLVVSFFFWALGTPEQHSYAGFLRSLLYQIASAQTGLVPMLLEKQDVSSGPLQAWTVARLEATLRHFLLHKPTSMSLCFVIDGLDEFSGYYEDNLKGFIDDLAQSSQTRVCVSSRPEQVFKEHFKESPQLRLQDLNFEDIAKTVQAELQAKLSTRFPEQEYYNESFLKSIALKAQGVFLWARIMIVHLRVGILDGRNFEELEKSLEDMPSEINKMYEHMLGKLDKGYFNEAIRYFQMLLRSPGELTLLHFIFAEYPTWCDLSIKAPEKLESGKFDDACDRLERRIHSHCAGLVEVAKTRNQYIGIDGAPVKPTGCRVTSRMRLRQEEANVSRHLRNVGFIHKTVVEFLSAHPKFSGRFDQSLAPSLGTARGRLGVMSLLPSITTSSDRYITPSTDWYHTISVKASPFAYQILCESPLLVCLDLHEKPICTNRRGWMELLDDLYKMLYRTNTADSLEGGQVLEFFLPLGKQPPFHNSAGFAAFFGCHAYISSQAGCDGRDRPYKRYLSTCAILGLDFLVGKNSRFINDKRRIPVFLGIQKVLLKTLEGSCDNVVSLRGMEESEWAIFLRSSIELLASYLLDPVIHSSLAKNIVDLKYKIFDQMATDWEALVRGFLLSGADINIPLYVEVYHDIQDGVKRVTFVFKLTALAMIRSLVMKGHPRVQLLTEELISLGAKDDYSVYSIGERGGTQHLLTTDQSTYVKHHPPKGSSLVVFPFLCMKATEPRPREPDSAAEAFLSQLNNESHGEFRDSITKTKKFLSPFMAVLSGG